ncbi:MAG: hypothetical protein AAF941_01145 [Pseudomonadota bacterium]
MPSLYAFAAPLALALPLLGQSTLAPVALASAESATSNAQAPDYDVPPQSQTGIDKIAPETVAVNPLNALREGQTVRQVRIERRVVVRISPQRGSNRNNLLAQMPQQALRTQFEERKMDKCVPVSGIAGVQTGSGNRLLLFLRDQRIITVNLEQACRARDFYSGFYVERNEDGNLCVARDKLQSRTGAKCEVERMRQLVAVNN